MGGAQGAPALFMRIQKYISQCGICSRRAAEKKILEGAVTVNGEPARIGQDVDPEKDRVEVDGAAARGVVSEKTTLAMNKPKGYLCSNSDPFDAKTVFGLLPPPFDKMKLFCCGRLDKNSQGLLILTAKELVRFLPPLTITQEDIDQGLAIFQKVLEG